MVDTPDEAKKLLDYGIKGIESYHQDEQQAGRNQLLASIAVSLYEMRTWFGQQQNDEPIATAPPEPVSLDGETGEWDQHPQFCPARHHEYGDCQLVEHEQWPIHLFRLDDGTLYPVAMGGQAVVTDKGSLGLGPEPTDTED